MPFTAEDSSSNQDQLAREAGTASELPPVNYSNDSRRTREHGNSYYGAVELEKELSEKTELTPLDRRELAEVRQALERTRLWSTLLQRLRAENEANRVSDPEKVIDIPFKDAEEIVLIEAEQEFAEKYIKEIYQTADEFEKAYSDRDPSAIKLAIDQLYKMGVGLQNYRQFQYFENFGGVPANMAAAEKNRRYSNRVLELYEKIRTKQEEQGEFFIAPAEELADHIELFRILLEAQPTKIAGLSYESKKDLEIFKNKIGFTEPLAVYPDQLQPKEAELEHNTEEN